MNSQQARALVTETFSQTFDKVRFRNFAINLLNHIDESKAQTWNSTYIKDAFKGHVSRFERLGTYTSPDVEKLDVLIVHLTAESKLHRARTAIRNFVADHLKTRDNKDAALVAFVSLSEKQWRFSYVKMEYATVEKDDGKVGLQTKLTPARRSSYIVGEGESCHTAQSRFLDLLQDTENQPSLTQIEDAFSVEAVTKEFFEQYKVLFLDLNDELDELATKDKTLNSEFSAKNVCTSAFAKKLMGQIVFLYFLQKKGWLGVPKGDDWGDGPHNFLRQLFDGKYRSNNNFFNDILEPLFYNTLATDRGHEAICEIFNCRIPFLNGGLFEPLRDYDWQKTDINIPNSLFSNTKTTSAGDIGTGILDVFDRYNFTVNEAEPLEKEVAIDPEMLGKVFEHLLEVKERKSKAAFYTPREFVHYMCQESLINYLDTAINCRTEPIGTEKRKQAHFGDDKTEQILLTAAVRKELVPRADIETFIHSGDQASYYETARIEGTSYRRKLPKTIETHARLLDDKLADITVCDLAIGSGAFPVGMMQEIVRARSALTPYFNDVHERTPYHFKRHSIQNCLYGVDIDPGAVEIAKLRLWLSLVVDEEDVKQIKPLPNLDFKIVTGNSLIGFPFKSLRLEEIEKLKARFFEEVDHDRKAKLKHEIDHKLTECFASSKKSLGYEVNFDFEIYFSEVFHRNGGFDVLIANPPYLFARNSEEKGITPEAKRYYYKNYALAEYQVNLYPLFIEKADRLLANHGILTFITPNNWLTINTNKTLRDFVLARSSILIVNFYARVFESADVDSVILIYEKGQHNPHVRLLEYTDTFHELKSAPSSFFTSQRESVINVEMFKGDSSSIELISKIEKNSTPLRLHADVKVGLGAYGLGKGIPAQTKDMIQRRIYHSNKKEGADWHKYLEGSDVCRYHLGWSGEYLKHGDHLREPRRNWALFSSRRILVRQIPNKLPYCIHACYTNETILNDRNSMNIINLKADPLAILAVLNSRLISFWFALKFGKLQRGLFPQFKANELEDFPIPQKLSLYEKRLSELAFKATALRSEDNSADIGHVDQKIDALVYEAFGLADEEVAVVQAFH